MKLNKVVSTLEMPHRKEYEQEKAAANACRSYPADKEAGFR